MNDAMRAFFQFKSFHDRLVSGFGFLERTKIMVLEYISIREWLIPAIRLPLPGSRMEFLDLHPAITEFGNAQLAVSGKQLT